MVTTPIFAMASVLEELNGVDPNDRQVAAISHGSLMGARGNSGVIFWQVLRDGAASKQMKLMEVLAVALAKQALPTDSYETGRGHHPYQFIAAVAKRAGAEVDQYCDR